MTPTLPQEERHRISLSAFKYATDRAPELESHIRQEAYLAGAIHEAERGREMTVAFGVWLAKNFYVSGEIEDRWYNPAGDGYTTAELLDIFIAQNQKAKA